MGRVSKLSHTGTLHITTHSLDALMKRTEKTGLDRVARRDLADALENLVHANFDAAEVYYEEVDNQPTKTWAVPLYPRFKDLIAVVRSDKRRTGGLACITVLTHLMAERNTTNGQWARTPERVGREELTSSPFTGLRESYPDAPPKLEEAKPPVEQVLVTWKVSGVLRLEHLLLYPGQIAIQLDRLNALPDVVDLTLWKKVPFEVKVKTTVEFDL